MLHFAPWKTALIVLVSLIGILLAIPNLVEKDSLKSWPEFMPTRQINLGLDLQGGSHLLLEVDIDAVVKDRLEAIEDEVRTALRGAKIRYRGLGATDKLLTVRIVNGEDLAQARSILEDLTSPLTTTLLGGAGGGRDFAVANPAGNELTMSMTDEAIDYEKTKAVSQSIEIVRRRIDGFGTNEPTIQRQGDDRILIQLPGVDDPGRVKDIIGKTAKLTFQLVDGTVSPQDLAAGRVPPGTEILLSDDGSGMTYAVKKRVMVSGENLVDAQPGFDSQTNEPIVSFRFDTPGAKRFGDVTAKNVGRPFAIVLDNRVISAPVIRSPILGGSGQISGGFSVEEANDLAVLLRAGALPAPLTVLEERSVGPDLGADSVEAGRIASAIAFVAVIVFMLACYGLFGLFANLALIVNVALIIGVLSVLQATLTLPGIAGIVLTIGMAVDANVLIFERIREELRAGKTPLNAVDKGYQQALSTILDANITTFIAAAILFSFGSGPVKGFSVTLAVGIVTSVFTAFVLTRLMIATYLRRTRPAQLTV